jgi:hypothetical protein
MTAPMGYTMKVICIILSLTGGTAFLFAADSSATVKLDSVPEAVRMAIEADRGESRIKNVYRRVHDGETGYEATFTSGDNKRNITYDAAGTKTYEVEKLREEALPDAVSRTVHEKIPNAKISECNKSINHCDGMVIYSVKTSRDNKAATIRLDERGKIIGNL